MIKTTKFTPSFLLTWELQRALPVLHNSPLEKQERQEVPLKILNPREKERSGASRGSEIINSSKHLGSGSRHGAGNCFLKNAGIFPFPLIA